MPPILFSVTFILRKMYSVNKEWEIVVLKQFSCQKLDFWWYNELMSCKRLKIIRSAKAFDSQDKCNWSVFIHAFSLIGLPSYFNIINRKSQPHDENWFQFCPCVCHENGELQFRWAIRKPQWNHPLNEQGHKNAQVLNLVFAQKLPRRDLKTDFRTSRSPDDLFSNLSPSPGGKWKIIAVEKWQ